MVDNWNLIWITEMDGQEVRCTMEPGSPTGNALFLDLFRCWRVEYQL